MGKLGSIAKTSDLMGITIKVNGETVKFNLYEELRIEPNNVNRDILQQPRLYSFVGAVHIECLKQQEEAEVAAKRTWAEIYVKFKKTRDKNTGRFYSDDMAKALAEKSTRYQVALRKSINAKEKSKRIGNCLEGFRQRKDLIQTISSNLRNNNS